MNRYAQSFEHQFDYTRSDLSAKTNFDTAKVSAVNFFFSNFNYTDFN